jgi:uncharacterized integral membrane protein (TIGR00698 family)
VAGIFIRSAIGVAPGFERGVAMASSTVLRVGLALVGLRLTLLGLGSLGLTALPVVAGCLAVAWLVIPWVARALGLRGSLVTLLTVGTSVCGCTAIMAVSPVIRARVEETGYAVTIVVIVGLTGMLLYPALAHWLFAADPRAAGIFLGTSIHDTSQVMGAALLYSGQYQVPEALDAATVTKLMRNLTLVVVVPVLALVQSRKDGVDSSATRSSATRIPGFVIAFVLMAAVRSLGDAFGGGMPGFAAGIWTPGLALANQVSELLLTIGMAAVGLTVELQQLRRVGWQPLAAGVVAAITMATVSIGLVKVFL